MLQRIIIENYALIEKLDIELNPQLNVIIGETGAGKSIIIDAISLILGQRVNRNNIRSGAKKMIVQCVFCIEEDKKLSSILNEMDVEVEDDQVILSRSLDSNGKNLCRVNGRAITVAQLGELGELLLDIHSQHEHNRLFKGEMHRELLDAYGGEPIKEITTKIAIKVEALKKLNKEIKTQIEERKELEYKRAFMTHDLKEILAYRLKDGEDKDLEDKKKLWDNQEVIFANGNIIDSIVNGNEINEMSGINSQLAEVEHSLNKLAQIDSKFEEFLPIIETISVELGNLSGEISNLLGTIDFSYSAYDTMIKRLRDIEDLKRKHGLSVGEIIEKSHQI